MINWPTAFVIAVAICAGAFLYNKPSDAAFGGSDHHSMLLDKTSWASSMVTVRESATTIVVTDPFS